MKNKLLIFLLIVALNSYGYKTSGKSVNNSSVTTASRASSKDYLVLRTKGMRRNATGDFPASFPKDGTAAGTHITTLAGNHSSLHTTKNSSFALSGAGTSVATITADLDLIITDLKKYFQSGTAEYNSIGHDHYATYDINNVGVGAAIPNAVISDLHLYPGAYFQAGAIGYAAAANITIDGLGNPDAKFIFSCTAAINFGANVKITLVNGAQACNVFWFGQGAAAAIGIGADVKMVGNCISEGGAIAVGIGTNLDGRAFTNGGAINMGSGTLTIPTGTSFINFRLLKSFLGFTKAGAIAISGIPTFVTGDFYTPSAYTNWGITSAQSLDPTTAQPIVSSTVTLTGYLYDAVSGGPSPCSVPTFTQVAAICSGATMAALPTSSTDTTPITGTWSPALNNTATTTYTFTPDVATTACASPVTMTIMVAPVTPAFTQVAAICSGATMAALPTSSTNTTPITGTWSPALNNTTTTTYTFTPDVATSPCASPVTMTIGVTPNVTPAFIQVAAIAYGATLAALPTSSTNATPIPGTWSPALNNLLTTIYTFTPTAGFCAPTTTMTITVGLSTALTGTRTPIATMNADLNLIIADLKKYFVIGTAEYNSIGHEHYGSYSGSVGQGTAIPNAVISDLHLYPGAYFQPGAIGYGAASNIIIDGLGDPNAKFIFSCTAAINFGANVKITLINGAKASNVFWFGQGAAAAIGIGANADMKGTCIAEGASAMSVGIGANLEGRIITTAGAMNFGPGNLAVPTGTSFINFRSLVSFFAFTRAGATDNVNGASDSIPPVSVTTISGDIFSQGAYTNFGFTGAYGGATASTFPTVALPVIQTSGHLYQFNGPSLCSVPTFTQVAAICSGATMAALPTSSADTTPITGTWSPALNNNATTTYTFTPDDATTACATPVTITISVTPNVTPAFTQVAAIGYGATLAALPTSSINATPITGTWSPALNNLLTTEYTFTPTAGICAPTTTMTIMVGSSTTWDGTAWSNGEPTSTTGIIISGNYTPSGAVLAYSMTVTNNAVVSIPTGINVTLTSKLTVEAGSSFTLNQNANLIQTDNVVNSGIISVKRDSNELSRLDYTMWSSPVANQNLLAFSPLTSLLPTIRFYNYDDLITHTYVSVASPSTTNFAIGTGYLIRMPNTSPSYPVKSLVTGVFSGTPNNGNVNLTGLTPARFYAVGNPYPSTINTNLFLDGNATDGTLYFWRKKNELDGTGTAYATYTKAGSTITATSALPDATIAVGQGFIVKTGSSATTLNFTNAMRTTSNTAQLFKTRAIENNRVWLNLTSKAGAFSQALVAYLTDATQGIDAGIDGKYINDSPVALTSIIDDTEFTIQGRALPFDPADTVPLNFKTDVDGDYSIAIDHFDGLFSTAQDIYLLDATNGVETDLKAGAYTFTAVAGSTNTRFSLTYQKTLKVDVNAFDENSVTVYKNKGIVYVNSAKSTINNIKVFDIQGRLIAEQKNVKATSATIKDLNMGRKVLIVQITSEENQVVNKKVVN